MRRVQDSRSGYKWGKDGLLTSDHTSTPPLVESVTWGDCKPQGRHAYCNFPLGMPKTIATRVESTYSNLRPFSFVNLKIKLCESASTTSCTANRAVKVPVCCLPIGQQQPPTSRAKHGECCCYRWLLKFEVKRLAAWCGGLQRLHLGVARHPKVSGMLSPQVCRVDLWGCDNKFGDLDRRLTTVLDLKLS